MTFSQLSLSTVKKQSEIEPKPPELSQNTNLRYILSLTIENSSINKGIGRKLCTYHIPYTICYVATLFK